MSATKLHYFNGRGLAETVRLMLAVNDEDFEEHYVTNREEFLELRDRERALTFGAMPMLEIDGLRLVQAMSIVRYLARKHGLYGRNDVDRVHIDIVADSVKDASAPFVHAPFKPDLAQYRAELDAMFIPRWFVYFERLLGANKDKGASVHCFVGDALSYADVMFAELVELAYEWSAKGNDALASYPLCVEHHRHNRNEVPRIKAFFDGGADSHRKPVPQGSVGKQYVQEVLNALGRT
jgi:glutathione S-transferase